MEVAKMRMRVQTAQVCLAEIHEYPQRTRTIAGVLEIVGLQDGIEIPVMRVRSREDLFHFELRLRTSGDDRLGPLFNRFVFLSPVLLTGVPDAAFLDLERYWIQRRNIQPSGKAISPGVTLHNSLERNVTVPVLPSSLQRAVVGLTARMTSSIGPS